MENTQKEWQKRGTATEHTEMEGPGGGTTTEYVHKNPYLVPIVEVAFKCGTWWAIPEAESREIYKHYAAKRKRSVRIVWVRPKNVQAAYTGQIPWWARPEYAQAEYTDQDPEDMETECTGELPKNDEWEESHNRGSATEQLGDCATCQEPENMEDTGVEQHGVTSSSMEQHRAA